MIVYGDPSFQESFRTGVGRLSESLSVPSFPPLDARRERLVQAGMLEQAVEDDLAGPWAARCRDATDACAEAFLDAWLRTQGRGRPAPSRSPSPDTPYDGFAEVPDALLTFKPPEGFAFYALYPEGHAVAAERWLDERPDSGSVLVVGIRSIGTTLSAVVAATLRLHGVPVRRVTVRPTGHPFHREVALDADGLRGIDGILVVDEGPGLSGSSMASVAEAAHRLGFPRARIAFLPGHGNEPGPQASEGVRVWWSSVPRRATPTERLRWKGRSLEETLADRTAPPPEIERVEELSDGRWRALAYRDEADWPAFDAPFERRKILVRRKDGTALLWKFVGFAEGEERERPARLRRPDAPSGFPPLPSPTLGFAPVPWIDGAPLTRDDLGDDVLQALARHLAATAGPPLPEAEARSARDRLAAMLLWNAKEAGIEAPPPAALPSGSLSDRTPSRSALDDRLAPHEWRRLADGAIVKIPRPHAGADPTVVGRQPLEWAVAAARVEWGLDAGRTDDLLAALEAQGVEPDLPSLGFHRMAYAAFRLGMVLHGAGLAAPEERERLARAERHYRAALTDAIAAFGPPTDEGRGKESVA